jgi:hypothetical protein
MAAHLEHLIIFPPLHIHPNLEQTMGERRSGMTVRLDPGRLLLLLEHKGLKVLRRFR